jgi:phage terminase large subunit-like protein
LTSSPTVARRGGVDPQARNVPAYVDTAGHEALDLAAQAGLVADEWQRHVIIDALGERGDGRWAAFEVGLIVGRQNGKGSVLEIRALAGLTLHQDRDAEERMILWSAHETKTAFEAFRRMEALFENYDHLRRKVKTVSYSTGREGIEMLNGARLRFVARSKGSGRGFSGDLIILDEAYALTADQMEAMLPTLAARPNPQVWYTSSPPLDGATGGQLYALRTRAKAGDPGLAWFDWGLQDVDLEDLKQINLDDRETWAATNPAYNIRIAEEFIERERRTLTPEGFARERLGVWPRRATGGSGVISADLWQDLADTEAQRPADVAFALHVNLTRTHAAIAYAGRRDDGHFQVGMVDYRPGTGWVVDRVVQLREKWNPIAVGVDTRSESLLLELEKAGITAPEDPEEPGRGDLAMPTAPEAASAFGLFVDTTRGSGLRHLDEAPINVALAGAKVRSLAGGQAWDHRSEVEVSPLVAVTLALWAYVTRVDAVNDDYDPMENIW